MEKKDLLDSHTHFSTERARLDEEIAPARAKALELDAAIQSARSVIKDDSVALSKADVERKRGRLAPAEVKKMQWALDDKEEALEVLLFQAKELKEHIDFLQAQINECKRRANNIKVVLSDQLVKQQAAVVARAAGDSLNNLIACLVIRINKESQHTNQGKIEYRRHLFASLGEAVYTEALINLDVADFGIPRFREAQQKVTAMIEAMGREHA
ncbi:MAG: hypothetical protein Q8Q50_08550 [Methylobacter sp.]|nr:hypothetical protein [Methylobacter sp.]